MERPFEVPRVSIGPCSTWPVWPGKRGDRGDLAQLAAVYSTRLKYETTGLARAEDWETLSIATGY